MAGAMQHDRSAGKDGSDTPAANRPIWAGLLPRCASDPLASAFLAYLEVRGLSHNTVLAYGRTLEGLIEFGGGLETQHLDVCRVHAFLRHLLQLPSRHPGAKGTTLSRATVAQRLAGLRAYADYLVDCSRLDRNPVARGGIYRTAEGEAVPIRRGLLPRPRHLPKLPTDEQWKKLLEALRPRPARDVLMFMLAYDGALRRNEVVTLRLDDFDFSAHQVAVRPENSKGGYGRTVIYSPNTGSLLGDYLTERRRLAPSSPCLFISASPRNTGRPVGGYTWGLLAAALAREVDVPGFSTHTLRHLRLTDLARAGLDIKELARFAGHRSLESTMAYIHLSGRDMALAFHRASSVLIDRFAQL
jgi:integrase/recombinase XerD